MKPKVKTQVRISLDDSEIYEETLYITIPIKITNRLSFIFLAQDVATVTSDNPHIGKCDVIRTTGLGGTKMNGEKLAISIDDRALLNAVLNRVANFKPPFKASSGKN